MLNADDLRLFLAVMREGNMVAAGRRLALDHSTVSRRLSALERALGTRLFDRSPRGLAPTEAAAALLDHAERIESELLAISSRIAGRDSDISGTVRLATPEVFGTCLVAPNVPLLLARHPRLLLELAPETRSISLSRRDADLAIMLRPPPTGRLVARKLIDYRLGLYASRSYLERHGAPQSILDLASRHFVSYIDELAATPDMIALDQLLPDAPAIFRSSSGAAQRAAVTAGIGLGILHLFAAEGDPELVRILPDQVEVKRSYWLVIHADLQRIPRVRAVISFLDDLVRTMQDRF